MRLVVCDDNLILGDALSAALRACGHQVVAITTCVAAGIAAVGEHLPDGCLLDLRFPSGEDGLAAARAIRLRYPGTAVVILSGTCDPAALCEARVAGVAGFLRKDQSVSQIAAALDEVAAGRRVYDKGLSSAGGTVLPRRAQPLYELTPREREVLRRIAAGQSTGQMATEMNIAASTLRTYVKNLFTKLGTHSRLQAAALVSREGLLAELSSA
jgi:two-component system, NarL family, nitrate/nitrite response regulator NarL